MAHRVCPWWLGYFLAHPWRKHFQDPAEILEPHIKPGMTVADIGCGMGFFSLDMARMAGDEGRVICVDLQPRMIKSLVKRARKAGVAGRIEERLCSDTTLGLDDLKESVDFVLAFAVVHEVPNQKKLFSELCSIIKPGGILLLAEPTGHIRDFEFQRTLDVAFGSGFEQFPVPGIWKSHTALLKKL